MPAKVVVFGDAQENTLKQAEEVAQYAERFALMADNHLGYQMPVGGVAAFDNKLPVAGVGYDIACGNCAMRTNLHIDALSLGGYAPTLINELADEIAAEISFGVGRKNKSTDAPNTHAILSDARWGAIPENVRGALQEKAAAQLGTVGSGNHYVDVFADEEGWIWVGVHFGSRGLGHTIATGYLALSAGEQWGAKVGEHATLLDLSTPIGQDYWSAMELAGEYAYAGREWVCGKVLQILGAQEVERVHNHHNFAWKEFHGDENDRLRELVVVRKGATPAWPGQRGFVGGSMGDNAVILRGATDDELNPAQVSALYSTVHGAGRVMSRTEARGKTNRRRAWYCNDYRVCDGVRSLEEVTDYVKGGPYPRCPKCGSRMGKRAGGEQLTEGKVTKTMMDEWVKSRGVVLRGAGVDESPHVYRRLPEVLAAQGNTIEVEHTLTPLIVVMAGADEFDPYKD